MFILPFEDPILVMTLLFVIILLVPFMGQISKLPTIVLLILMGMLAGPHGFGLLERDSQLILLEKTGLLYIMLLAGIQMDLSNLSRLGKRSLIFGLLTFSIPFGFGLLAGKILGLSLIASCIIGLIFSPHVLIAYPTIIRLGLGQTECIGVTVGATAITSFLTLAVFSVIEGSAVGSLGPIFWGKILLGLPALVLFSLWSVPKLGRALIKESSSSQTLPYTFILAALFVISSLTGLLGINPIVGAFIAGLILNPLVPLKSQLMSQIEFVGNGIFIPCFLISVGVLCNPGIFVSNPGIISTTLLVFALSFLGKAVPVALICPLFNYSKSEGVTMFSLTMARAALVVVIALFAQKFDLISDEIFNVAIAYILLTCFTGAILTEWIAPKLATSEAAS